MTDALTPTADPALLAAAPALVYDPQKRAAELAVVETLRGVMDPELGMDIVELGLIRQIIIGDESSEIKMILTTPFCPYAGSMLEEVRANSELVLAHPVKVTLLAEAWDPRDAGLSW